MEEFPSGQRGRTVNPLLYVSVVQIHPPPPKKFMRKWLSGRASPCQGEGREFESRLPLQTTTDVHTSVLLYMNDQLSWIERLATDQKVGGSNPLSFAKTIAIMMIARVFFLFLHNSIYFQFKYINFILYPIIFKIITNI